MWQSNQGRVFATLLMATVAAAVMAWGTSSKGAIIAQYGFGTVAAPSAASTDTDANSVASLFADGDGTLNYSTSVGNAVPSAFKSYTDTPSAYGGTAYFSFTIAPVAGYSLDLSQLVFDLQRDRITGSSANSARAAFDVRSNAGGDTLFATSLGAYALNDNSGTFVLDFTVATNAAKFLDLTSTTEFRIYVKDDGYSNTTTGLHVDNVELSGSATLIEQPVAVPEPASVVIWSLLLGGCGAGTRTWRRRRA